MIITHPHFYGLYGHNKRNYNVIMTFDPDTATFKFSIPNFGVTWSATESVPAEVLEHYRQSEQSGLLRYWQLDGHELIINAQ